jgi:hypothetical protein
VIYVIDLTKPEEESARQISLVHARVAASCEGRTLPALLIVGNKTDLLQLRKISHDDASQLACKYSAKYCEASARDVVSVVSAFETALQDALQRAYGLDPLAVKGLLSPGGAQTTTLAYKAFQNLPFHDGELELLTVLGRRAQKCYSTVSQASFSYTLLKDKAATVHINMSRVLCVTSNANVLVLKSAEPRDPLFGVLGRAESDRARLRSWRIATHTFRLADELSTAAWHHALRFGCAQVDAMGKSARKRALVLINPVCGFRIAAQTFSSECRPLLEAAGFALETTTLTHKGHAQEIASALATESFDVLIICGGDGTVNEVVNGVLKRPDWRSAAALPIAIIPCGSGNGIGMSVGASDTTSAVVNVVLGRRTSVDAISLSYGNEHVWGCGSISWGWLNELEVESEARRHLGPLVFQRLSRQDMLQKTLRPVHTVQARLSVLLAADAESVEDERAKPPCAMLRCTHEAEARWQPTGARSHGNDADPALAAACNGPTLSTQTQHEALNVSSANRWQIVADEFSVVLAVSLPFLSTALRADPSQFPGAGCLSLMVRQGHVASVQTRFFATALCAQVLSNTTSLGLAKALTSLASGDLSRSEFVRSWKARIDSVLLLRTMCL